jgi:hypothetical protein
MKYKTEICQFIKIVRSLKMRMIRKIAVIIIPEIITGRVLLRGAKRIMAFRMNRIIASANHVL